MKELRIGMVGCGSVFSVKHAEGFKEIESKVVVTSVCDIVKERAEKAKDLLGAEHATTDYREMLDYVDAVFIALPHDLHCESGVYFLRNKKHVLMEKPLCNTEAECLRLIDIAEQEKLVLMTAYPVPYIPSIMKLKEIADSKEYGDIVQMTIWTEQATALTLAEDSWFSTARLGGGQLFSHGCHYIDLLLRFLGEPVSGVHLGTNVGTYPLLEEGTSNVIMKFKNGALGYHFGTWGARGFNLGYMFQIQFEKGLVLYSPITKEIRLFQDNTRVPNDPYFENNALDLSCKAPYKVLYTNNTQIKDTFLEILHFADCIINNRKPMTDARSSLQSLRVIWKMYEAEKNGQIADLRGLGIGDYRKPNLCF